MDGSCISIVKKIPKRKNMDDSQSRSKGGSIIIEVDEVTHDLMLNRKS